MAAAKVVRVEEVVGDVNDLEASSSADILIPSAHLSRKASESSAKASGSESCESGHTESTGIGEEEEEAKDKVYPLPANWPRIAQLDRPKSCALSASRLPCVRKAVSHLELIQNIIDEWFKRSVEEVKSGTSTRRTSMSSSAPQGPPKKQLRFRDPSTRSTTRTGMSSLSKSSEPSSTSLSVTGIGAETPASSPEADGEEDGGFELPYLGAEDVIDEVITLLARLETDRQNTLQRFQQEVDTGFNLKSKIDGLCLRRLKELPELVQREHEACIVDMNELQWHLAYTTRTQAKSQQRKDNSQLMNSRLKEDIEFVRMHIPLVEEKLVLELQAMDRIKKAQVETNQELMTTKQRQAKTEQKSTEALNKAETERGHIRRELDNVRDNLTQISEELSTAKMTFNSYVHQVNDIGHQLVDNAQELDVLSVKDDNAKASEDMQATKVRTLQAKITDAEFEYRRLENENIQAEEELKIMKTKNAARLAELTQKSKVLEGKLRVILRHNNELSIEIEDTQEKINKCEQQKISDEKNIRRIQREMERVALMMQATTDEHLIVSTRNHHVRDQLHSEQEKAFRTEESLKNTTETLRRQVKEEVHTRTVLQARINSDSVEIEKTRSESGKKKEKADKVANDVQSAVTVVLEKVEKLRDVRAQRDKQKVSLQSEIEGTEQQYKENLNRFEEKLAVITPHYNHLKRERLPKLEKEEAELREKLEEALAKIKELAVTYEVKFYAQVERRQRQPPPLIVHISLSESDRFPPAAETKPGLRVSVRNAVSDEDMKEEVKYPRVPTPPLTMLRKRDEVGEVDKVLDQMAWKTDLMTKKIEEMDSAQTMMNKVSAKTEAKVDELEEEQEELDKQLESLNKINDGLKAQLTAVTDRIKDGDTRHQRLLQDRCAVLLQQDDDKTGGLRKNKDLASRYRQLQNEFLVKKEQLLRTFDDRLKLEATINDIKQLKSLQSKMHGALSEYFKLSGLYNEGELTRLEQVSADNGHRVGQLQADMEEALGLITSFLQTEMDGTRARQMAWEAVQKMETRRRQSMAPENGAAAAPAPTAAPNTPMVFAS